MAPGKAKRNTVPIYDETPPVGEAGRALTVRRRMAATRADILARARAIIATGGVPALTARTLARAASVSLSTLYSLVGKREDILAALLRDMQERVRARVAARAAAAGLASVEALAIEVAALYAEDEGYYRAAYLALEHLDETNIRSPSVRQVHDWGEDMIRLGFAQCAAAGLLRGRVPIAMIVDGAVQGYRGAYRRWGYGQITLAQARAITLAQSYVLLMADATDAFRATLDARIAALAADGVAGA